MGPQNLRWPRAPRSLNPSLLLGQSESDSLIELMFLQTERRQQYWYRIFSIVSHDLQCFFNHFVRLNYNQGWLTMKGGLQFFSLSCMHTASVLCVFWAHASDFVTTRPFLMRLAEMSTDQDWIGLNFFQNWWIRTGSDWENFCYFDALILKISKILVVIRFHRFAKW